MPKPGYKQSPETIAKRVASLKRFREQNPESEAARKRAVEEARVRWHADPKNAAAFAARSSERMKRRHADPEWQKVRDARSSRVGKEVWARNREHMTALSVERYASMASEGTGLCSNESEAKRDAAGRWIMTRAQEAMRAETDYDAKYTEAQARVRAERPYLAAEWPDYIDYCSWCGTQTVNDPELRAIADAYLSQAIPRFAAEWRKTKERT